MAAEDEKTEVTENCGLDLRVNCAATCEAVLNDLADCPFVRFESVALNGESVSKLVPANAVGSFVRGGLDFFSAYWAWEAGGAVLPKMKFAEAVGYPNCLTYVDPASIREVPWVGGDRCIKRILFEPEFKGCAVPHPRTVCRNLLSILANEANAKLYGAFEYEFQVFNSDLKPVTDGVQIFHTIRNFSWNEELCFDVWEKLQTAGIKLNTMNGEYASGQQEWTMQPSWGIEVADDAFTFKNGVKEMFQKAGYHATFMTRAFGGLQGIFNGGHYNFSVWDESGDTNLFYDEATGGLSDFAKQCLAGILAHAHAICAFANPHPADYARLNVHTWAPHNVSWDMDNRAAMVRVKNIDKSRTYFELRLPGSGANPYLVQAGVLAAMIDGVRNNMECPEPMKDPYHGPNCEDNILPRNLKAACDALEADETMKDLLSLPGNSVSGADLVELFCDAKRTLVDTCEKAIAEAGQKEEFKVYRDNLFDLI